MRGRSQMPMLKASPGLWALAFLGLLGLGRAVREEELETMDFGEAGEQPPSLLQAEEVAAEAVERSGSVLGHKEGDLFDGQFRLEKHLGTMGRGVSGSLLESRGNPHLRFPAAQVTGFQDPKYLCSGSFGEAWRAEATTGPLAHKKVVVKILYIKEEVPSSNLNKFHYLTKQFYEKSGYEAYKSDADEAKRECRWAQMFQEQAYTFNQSGSTMLAPLAQRLMQCYDHNIKTSTKWNTPMYLVLEYCGDRNLHQWVDDNKGNKDVLSSMNIAIITRQLTEGLRFLASMTPVVIHHDFKAQNIMINEGYTDRLLVKLVDFGASFKTTKKPRKRFVPCSGGVAPPENWQGWDYAKPAESFDMFSLGNTITKMAIGKKFAHIWSPFPGNPYAGAVYGDRDYFKKGWTAFYQRMKLQETEHGWGAYGLDQMNDDSLAVEFAEKNWVKMVAVDPRSRPKPIDVLSHPWLQSAPDFVDPDWKLYEPQQMAAATATAAAAEGDNVDDPLAGCNPEVCMRCTSVPRKTVKGKPKYICGVDSGTVTANKWILQTGPYKDCKKSPKSQIVGGISYYMFECPKWEPSVEAKTPIEKKKTWQKN